MILWASLFSQCPSVEETKTPLGNLLAKSPVVFRVLSLENKNQQIYSKQQNVIGRQSVHCE